VFSFEVEITVNKPQDKAKMSRRRQQDENAIAKQVKIAKSHNSFNDANIKQPHRLVKHHAMDCGNPECYLCGNPRKTHKDRLTAQEHRLFQDLDHTRNRNSNGTSNQNSSH
jgi:hypothetical protein